MGCQAVSCEEVLSDRSQAEACDSIHSTEAGRCLETAERSPSRVTKIAKEESFRALELPYMTTHVILQLFKSVKLVKLGVDLTVNCGLWVIMRYQL